MSSSDFSAFALFTAGLAVFAPAVSALVVPGGSNPTAGAINLPGGVTSVTAGQSVQVTWVPKTDVCDDKVDLVLLYGPASNQMNAISYIKQGIDNSGSFTWTPDTSLTASEGTSMYGIELVCDKTQAYQYTSRFGLVNKNAVSSSLSSYSSASASASSSASSSASASSASASVSASSSASASASKSSSEASSEATESPKYPTGNSTTSGSASGSTAGAATGATTTGVVTSTKTGSGSGSKTSDSSSQTGSASSSGASASSSSGSTSGAGNLKAGFSGLLIAAAIAAFAF